MPKVGSLAAGRDGVDCWCEAFPALPVGLVEGDEVSDVLAAFLAASFATSGLT